VSDLLRFLHLGKIVIPITQNITDIPSDMGHHGALKYLSNQEGLTVMIDGLSKRVMAL
jgi:hypothetical protein